MKVRYIKGQESFEEWLKAHPQADAVVFFHRAALREMPHWTSAMDQLWARQADVTALPIVRLNLTLGVARKLPTSKIKKAAALAFAFADSAADDAAHAALAARAADAGRFHYVAATDAYFAAAHSYASDAGSAHVYGTGADQGAFWKQVRWDAQQIEKGQDLLNAPLWPEPPPDWFIYCEQKSRALWSTNPSPWSFWLRWWDGALSGKQLDWNLQRQVALIPDAIWQQGPAAVAEAIREIEELFDLRRQVSALRGELEALTTTLTQQASAHRRSHNNPPELVDAPAQIMVQVNTLVTTLRETEAELAKPAPNKSLLRKLAEALRDGSVAVLRYCAGLTDAALQEGAKSVGKWAGGALTVYLASEPVMKGIASLAEAILTHLGKFP